MPGRRHGGFTLNMDRILNGLSSNWSGSSSRSRPSFRPGSHRPDWGEDGFFPSEDWDLGGNSAGPVAPVGWTWTTRPGRPEQPQPPALPDGEPQPDPQPEDPPEGRLEITNIDWHLPDNRREHHTSEYEDTSLIVRRGQTFKVTIKVNRAINREQDRISLRFKIGERPLQSRGTIIAVPIVDSLNIQEWGSTIDYNSYTSVTFTVMSPAHAVVGRYDAAADIQYTTSSRTPKLSRQKLHDKVIVLFNAWCPDDLVYVHDKSEREEYILNQTGRIYKGGKGDSIIPKPWNFGQMDRNCLEAALFLLRSSYLEAERHGNPVLVTRALSAQVNDTGSNTGVLTGRWQKPYYGGTEPWRWNGSVTILEQFMKDKRPVKYGQCWVFSGVLTTVCRALGIATRSVSNYDSAHDKDGSISIDRYLDTFGRKIPISDSVWNFHVWNEVWFQRPDLPDGNDGWQVIDSTPQETSEGMYRCGPAPVNAIKEGNVYLGYDAKFIFAEVNGDRLDWLVKDNDINNAKLIRSSLRTTSVGKNISTKAVGSTHRQDITMLYKYPEGSKEERHVVEKASKFSSRRDHMKKIYDSDENDDVTFELIGEMDDKADLSLTLRMQNTSQEVRSIAVRMYANAEYYMGLTGEELNSLHKRITITAGKVERLSWSLTAAQYLSRLDEDANLAVSIMAEVSITRQIYHAQKIFVIQKKDLDIQVSDEQPRVGESVEVNISFTNPLAIRLTKCSLYVEGPGLLREIRLPIRKILDAGQSFEQKVTLTPRLAGKREVIASFNSRELTEVAGAKELHIQSS